MEVGRGRRRALLAVLLLHANEVVSSDRLIDELWGERAPATAPKILQSYVSQLRKALADEGGGSILVTRSPGYALQLEPGELDADRFVTLLAKGRAAMAAEAADDAATLLREALGLWRGPPLADFAYDSFAAEEIARLEELRLSAVEERIDADLALGRQADLVPELETFVAHHPLRERPRGQLMLALYRCGRQAEALHVYQEARRTLLAELGLEPSRALQLLEQAILQQSLSLDLQPQPTQATEFAAGMERQPADDFVGRKRELTSLLNALDDARSGRGRLFLIGGEPGIGKSRLAEELARRADREDVYWGRCWEMGGAPPYWPWVQAIRSYVRERNSDELRSELGPGAADIADLVPDIRELLPDTASPAMLPESEHRFRLFSSIADFLKSASRSRPLVLILEDLNWADDGSLLLLEFVARELADAHVLLIGTYRDIDLSRGHPLAKTLGELARDRLFERVLLGGLSHADVERFIDATCAFVPDRALVRALHAQTEGNPFFVGEVVRLLAEEGALTLEALGTPERWSARIPEGVRDVIGRRLERLSRPCNDTLTVASAIGREFTLDQLARLMDDLSEQRLLEVLEEARAAYVIEELPGPGRYQFTHALIQGTLFSELSLAMRARLHARIAAALEELYGARIETHAAELAYHFAEAQAILGPDKFVRYSALAGEAALTAHAPEQALAHFQLALAAKGDQPIDDETAELFFGLGRAQLATFAPDELEPAVTSLRRAFEHYADAGDVGRAAAVVAHPLPLSLGIAQTKMPELIARALSLVPRDSLDEGRLLVWHGWFSVFTDADYEAAQRAFQRVRSIAERKGDAALLRKMLANAAFVDAFHLRFQDCLTKGLRATELAQSADDTHTEMASRRAAAWALAATGEGERARIHTAAALAHAEKLHESWWLTSTTFSHELLCLYEGDWPGAREMSELGLAAEPQDPRHLALRAALEYELGDYDAGAEYIARLQEVTERAPPPGPIADHVFLATVIPLTGRIANTEERLDAAESAAERVVSLPGVAPVMAMNAKSGLALIAVQKGDADAARELYGALEAQRGTANFFIPLTIDRLLGLLAAAFDRIDVGLAHLADGLAFCDRAGYRPEYAWTASDYAEVLLQRAGADDHARAIALQDEALAIARELGMHPLIDRVLAGRRAPKT